MKSQVWYCLVGAVRNWRTVVQRLTSGLVRSTQEWGTAFMPRRQFVAFRYATARSQLYREIQANQGNGASEPFVRARAATGMMMRLNGTPRGRRQYVRYVSVQRASYVITGSCRAHPVCPTMVQGRAHIHWYGHTTQNCPQSNHNDVRPVLWRSVLNSGTLEGWVNYMSMGNGTKRERVA